MRSIKLGCDIPTPRSEYEIYLLLDQSGIKTINYQMERWSWKPRIYREAGNSIPRNQHLNNI